MDGVVPETAVLPGSSYHITRSISVSKNKICIQIVKSNFKFNPIQASPEPGTKLQMGYKRIMRTDESLSE